MPRFNLHRQDGFDPAAVDDLKKLDRAVQQRLLGFLRTRVASLDNPRAMGEALSGAKLGSYPDLEREDILAVLVELGRDRLAVRA